MMRRSRIPSRGLAMIAVLALLMIVGGFSLTIVRSLAARRQMMQTEERRAQAEWLAEAGIERAAAKPRASGDDETEIWNIAEEELGGQGAGRVTIRWAPSMPETKGCRVEVEAEYPADVPTRAVVRREFILNLDAPIPGDNP